MSSVWKFLYKDWMKDLKWWSCVQSFSYKVTNNVCVEQIMNVVRECLTDFFLTYFNVQVVVSSCRCSRLDWMCSCQRSHILHHSMFIAFLDGVRTHHLAYVSCVYGISESLLFTVECSQGVQLAGDSFISLCCGCWPNRVGNDLNRLRSCHAAGFFLLSIYTKWVALG